MNDQCGVCLVSISCYSTNRWFLLFEISLLFYTPSCVRRHTEQPRGVSLSFYGGIDEPHLS